MADLFPTNSQLAAQTAPAGALGSLFGENTAAVQAAREAIMQRMQAMQTAQLTPEQNGAFMAANAGNLLGGAAMKALAPPTPDPVQVKLAQIKQKVDAQGITDPEKSLRVAASELIQAGMYPQAVEAQKQADSLAKGTSSTKLQDAQADESRAKTVESLANTGKTQQATAESAALAPYKAMVEKAKAEMKDPASIKALAEASKATTEQGVVVALADARIGQLRAEAAKDKTLSEKEGKQSDWELVGDLMKEKVAGTITQDREGLLNAIISIKSRPQTVVGSMLGGDKTADSFLNPQAQPVPAEKVPGLPTLPSKPSSGQTASGSILPKGIPQGSKMIGTSGGKPVYQTPDGKRLIVK